MVMNRKTDAVLRVCKLNKNSSHFEWRKLGRKRSRRRQVNAGLLLV